MLVTFSLHVISLLFSCFAYGIYLVPLQWIGLCTGVNKPHHLSPQVYPLE